MPQRGSGAGQPLSAPGHNTELVTLATWKLDFMQSPQECLFLSMHIHRYCQISNYSDWANSVLTDQASGAHQLLLFSFLSEDLRVQGIWAVIGLWGFPTSVLSLLMLLARSIFPAPQVAINTHCHLTSFNICCSFCLVLVAPSWHEAGPVIALPN